MNEEAIARVEPERKKKKKGQASQSVLPPSSSNVANAWSCTFAPPFTSKEGVVY
jgi:hypothetical protein